MCRTRHLTFDTLDVRLGATRFRALAHAPDGWLSPTGGRRSAYAESHWFGNPGSYQVYVLGYNDAGTGHYKMPPPLTIGATANAPHVMGGRLRPETGSRPSWDPLPVWLQPAHDKTTVNTLTVLGPVGDVTIQGWPGVDGDVVRLLRQAFTNREIRQRRRAHRKAMRRAPAPAPELADDPDPAVPERSDD